MPHYAEAFYAQPGQCFRFVHSGVGHAQHCPEPVTHHGVFVDAKGKRWRVEACATHSRSWRPLRSARARRHNVSLPLSTACGYSMATPLFAWLTPLSAPSPSPSSPLPVHTARAHSVERSVAAIPDGFDDPIKTVNEPPSRWDQAHWRVCVGCRQTKTRWRDADGRAFCPSCRNHGG
jgi:hypothetical protein